MIQDAGCNVACDYVQVDESALPVIDKEKRRIPEYEQAGKDYADLLPGNWRALSAK